MPPHFSSTYTPIAAAGTPGQIKHVARLIGAQLTAAGLGPGAKHVKKKVPVRLWIMVFRFNLVMLWELLLNI